MVLSRYFIVMEEKVIKVNEGKKQMNGAIDGWSNRAIDGWSNRAIDGWSNSAIDGWSNRWMEQ